MNKISEELFKNEDYYAAGLFEKDEKSSFYKHANAQYRCWENAVMPKYSGGSLYPCGNILYKAKSMIPNFSFSYYLYINGLDNYTEMCKDAIKKEEALLKPITKHTLGGAGYVHSIPHFSRILKEGLNSYEKRILNLSDSDFKEGLLLIIKGIKLLHHNMLMVLENSAADINLVKTFKKVPFYPSTNIYEAIMCINFIYYVDGCDNIGDFDGALMPYYKGEDIVDILNDLFLNIEVNNGWVVALGANYNAITMQCLEAIKGKRRPNLELRVTEDMPKEIWQAVINALKTGCGNPCLYNEKLYQENLHKIMPEIPKEDLLKMSGGGCTETMLTGISNVGSIDAGINALALLERLINKDLKNCKKFENFCDLFINEFNKCLDEASAEINEFQISREKYRPQPVRTLLIDDCIQKEKDFNAGGARYYWSVINIGGIVNVIDSLLAIKYAIYDNKIYSAENFVEELNLQTEKFKLIAKKFPCFGVDDDVNDNFAKNLVNKMVDCFNDRKTYLGGKMLPASIMFVTYADAGKYVNATPDGRNNAEALADSLSAISGKDIYGITAMLNSVAKLPLNRLLGTPVVNVRFEKKYIDYIEPIIKTFFDNGGMQIQISCLSKEDMLDAQINPEKHGNLIVRIGGYSEYFNRLSKDLQDCVIKRTEFIDK